MDKYFDVFFRKLYDVKYFDEMKNYCFDMYIKLPQTSDKSIYRYFKEGCVPFISLYDELPEKLWFRLHIFYGDQTKDWVGGEMCKKLMGNM